MYIFRKERHRLTKINAKFQQANWVSTGVSSPPTASTPHAPIPGAVLPNGHQHVVFPPVMVSVEILPLFNQGYPNIDYYYPSILMIRGKSEFLDWV